LLSCIGTSLIDRLDWSRERAVKRVLKRLAGQRIATILQPGNVWVIEKALSGGPGEDEALRTCQLRGWIESLGDLPIPTGEIDPNKPLPSLGKLFTRTTPFYRITSAGWDQINRTHTWLVWTFMVSLAALAAAIVGMILRR
jgi:hypothetical protein